MCIVEKFGTLTIRRSSNEIISKLNQNYGKVEMNNKVLQSPAPWNKKKALHFGGKSKLEIIKKSARQYTVCTTIMCHFKRPRGCVTRYISRCLGAYLSEN